MTNAEAQVFAESWIGAWNDRDVEAVLALFAEGAEFTSPKAAALMGKAAVHAPHELAEYWYGALRRVGSIRFTLNRVVNDAPARRVTIVYVSEIDGKKTRAGEFFEFDESGKVVRGEAMYGAAVE